MAEQDWQAILKREWNERAASPQRDFYVASHKGWDDAAAWSEQARTNVKFALTGLDPAWLALSHALEVGCGVGRLVPEILQVARSYSGFDVSGLMIDEARRRCAHLPNARFFESDGAGVPPGLRDRQYGFILAIGVLIHCPESIIRSSLQSAWELLAPGGQIRMQLLGDLTDHTGIADPEIARQNHAQAREVDTLPHVNTELTTDRHYWGRRFRYAEVEPFIQELLPGEICVVRLDLMSIYAIVEKSRAREG